MVIKIGIDDAGRGPVLGPMILAGVLIEKDEQETQLKELGVKDSKMIFPSKRKKIAKQITENFKHFIVKTTPKEIDDSENLNTLEAIKSAMIINKLTENIKEKVRVVVDCPSVNKAAWTETLIGFLRSPGNIELSCEHKADVNHPIVSAASIIAKEMREYEMKRLRKEKTIDFGSGYPADPKTKEFIQSNFSNPKYKDLIRFSWSTVQKLVKESDIKQKKLF